MKKTNLFKLVLTAYLKSFFTRAANAVVFANNLQSFQKAMTSHQQVGYMNFIKIPNMTLNASPTYTVTVGKEDLCLVECFKARPPCFGLNFVNNMKNLNDTTNCHLFQEEVIIYDLLSNSNVYHYSLQNPCLILPCKNGGLCIRNVTLNTYVCKCEYTYSGRNCVHWTEDVFESCSNFTV